MEETNTKLVQSLLDKLKTLEEMCDSLCTHMDPIENYALWSRIGRTLDETSEKIKRTADNIIAKR